MKRGRKLNNILLGGLFCAVSFAFASNVKADELKYQYPVYGNGSTILYNERYNFVCNSESDSSCSKYIVSGDDGEEDFDILLTKEGETTSYSFSKVDLSSGYVLHTTKPVDLSLDGKGANGENVHSLGSLKNITYYKSSEDVNEAINSAKLSVNNNGGYANVYFDYVTNNNLTIPEKTTLTTPYIVVEGELINNGTIKTSSLEADKVSGSGNINLIYDYTMGDPDYKANRLIINEINGVKLNVITSHDLEGLQFGNVGLVSSTSKEDAQRKIDQLNSVRGNTLTDYVIELDKAEMLGDDNYVGVLKKKTQTNESENQELTNNKSENQELTNKEENKETAKKNEVKNPSTYDATNSTAIIIIVSGVLAAITFKKVKQK